MVTTKRRSRGRTPTGVISSRPRSVQFSALCESIGGKPGNNPALKIDRDAGVIFGVKVCGSHSPNCHDVKGVTAGTRYTEACLRDAVARGLYEDVVVYTNHPPRSAPYADRSVEEPLGKLRNARYEADEAGQPCIRADLYYLKPHRLAESICDDVERGLGVFGLSHNSISESERVDAGVLFIDRLQEVVSVDLVDKPATVKNLWESQRGKAMTKTTARNTIKSWLGAALRTEGQRRTAKRLIEDDMPALDATVTTEPETSDDPDEALKAGFRAALIAVIDAEDMDAAAKLAKLKELLNAHEKLAGDDGDVQEEDEPDGDEAKQEEDDDEDKKDDAKQEEDDDEKDEPKSESRRRLKRERDVLALCLREKVTPPAAVLKALNGLDDEADRMAVVKAFKAQSNGGPRSRAPGSARLESADDDGIPSDVGGMINFLRS